MLELNVVTVAELVYAVACQATGLRLVRVQIPPVREAGQNQLPSFLFWGALPKEAQSPSYIFFKLCYILEN